MILYIKLHKVVKIKLQAFVHIHVIDQEAQSNVSIKNSHFQRDQIMRSCQAGAVGYSTNFPTACICAWYSLSPWSWPASQCWGRSSRETPAVHSHFAAGCDLQCPVLCPGKS
jgi:hypothetical protein